MTCLSGIHCRNTGSAREMVQDIVPEEKQNDFKQPGDRFRKMNPRE